MIYDIHFFRVLRPDAILTLASCTFIDSMTLPLPAKPIPAVSVHFLGTCSGGGPIPSRNCSSLAVDFGNDIWLFDAADGTLGRLHQSSLKMANISRIFITHMHADHVLGLVAIMATIMSGVGTTEASLEKLRELGTGKQVGSRTRFRSPLSFDVEAVSARVPRTYPSHALLLRPYCR